MSDIHPFKCIGQKQLVKLKEEKLLIRYLNKET